LSLRAAIFALVFANLAFFGWAHLVDVAPEPPPSESIEHLPQLKLLSEVQNSSAAARSSVTRRAQASSGTSNSGGASVSASGGASVSAGAGSSSSSAANQAVPAPATPVTRIAAASGSAQRCVTVGPFNDPDRVARASDILRERGFTIHDRIEQVPEQGFWVFVGDLRSESDETTVVRKLQQNGVSDATAMPDSNAGRRVSVGFFTAQDGAERRARTVRGLGLHADIEKRTQDAPVHWVDVNIDSSTQSLPAEGLLSLEESGERLEIKECPHERTGELRSGPSAGLR